MKNRALTQGVALASAILFIGAMSLDADARGGGGARMAGASGGFSHGGTARGGSFAARSTQRGAVAGGGGSMGVSDRAGTHQDFRADRTEGRQDLRGERQDDFTDRQDDRQDYRDEVRDDRQDFREEARDDWQDYDDDRDDHWDNWATGAAVVAGAAIVGSAITAATYDDLDCTRVIVDGFTYSDCGGTWYKPVYSDGDVTYVVVNAPPGY
jgi:hypothetical protein